MKHTHITLAQIHLNVMCLQRSNMLMGKMLTVSPQCWFLHGTNSANGLVRMGNIGPFINTDSVLHFGSITRSDLVWEGNLLRTCFAFPWHYEPPCQSRHALYILCHSIHCQFPSVANCMNSALLQTHFAVQPPLIRFGIHTENLLILLAVVV